MTANCYVCGKPLTASHGNAYLEDDDHRAVPVGNDCLRRVIRAGYDGLRSSKDRGPLVFIERRMAEAYARASKGRCGQTAINGEGK